MPKPIRHGVDDVFNDYRRVRQALYLAHPDWLAFDIPMSQVKAVLTIRGLPAASVGSLANALGIGMPAASILTEKLVHAGLVERREDPADRRRVIVRLTEKGEDVANRVWDGPSSQLREWIAALQPEDREALGSGLRALAIVATSPRKEAVTA